MTSDYSSCTLCPRECRADRTKGIGACGVGSEIRLSRVSVHAWEEPCISGSRGSGTFFFSGCSLKCVFCQNAALSRGCAGEDISEERLAGLFLRAQSAGVHNINLVTPTHFTPGIVRSLSRVRDRLEIPVVWNSSGYEKPETLESTRGLVDVFLPDFKYSSSETAKKLSGCPDYPETALRAIEKMYEIAGDPVMDEDGLIRSGVVVRHLCLPGRRKESVEALGMLASAVPVKGIILSLMSQYTPDFYSGEDKSLHRRLTTFEYESVVAEARRLGFSGYTQSRSSQDAAFTPGFTDRLQILL